MSDEYYLQDKRQMVGNSMYWWRKNGAGYCCDVREAHVFTRKEAFSQHEARKTDVPWPKAYIDAHIAHHVDFQRVDLDQARAMEELPPEVDSRYPNDVLNEADPDECAACQAHPTGVCNEHAAEGVPS